MSQTDPINEAPLTYEEARELARHHDINVRKSIAEREDIRPEILFYLAGDPSEEVRKAISNNKSTPAQAYVELAKDASDEVRSTLAEKISQLAPKLTAHEIDKVQSYTYQALEILASDQLNAVRSLLSETLKDVAGLPEDLILNLARDSELSVSGPILENSPVLTDEALLEIISTGLSSGALGAISKRNSVSSLVSDAIVDTNDVSAITVLLSNESAQIREETLDLLVEKSEKVEEWHGPLVKRPILSERSVLRLAEFVADNLLQNLKSRDDLSPTTLRKVRNEFNRRLEQSHKAESYSTSKLVVDGTNKDLKKEYAWLFQQPGNVIAQNLMRMGKLNPQVVANALNEGEEDFVIAGLAELARMSLATVQRMITMRSARAVAALCWKAGLDASTAVRIQVKIAHIPVDDILKDQNNEYTLSHEELEWQLDFFRNMAV